MKQRLDIAIFSTGLANSRERAKQLIKSGSITVNGKPAAKASLEVDDEDVIELVGSQCPYVGRGGLKLEKAISLWQLDVCGLVCLDIGASTGGFTDCLLQNGAKLVYAVDVGHDQLDESLRADSRVVSMERTNIRTADASLFENVSFICMDVSFVSIRLIIPRIAEILSGSGEAVLLIKPQFEAGKGNVGKNGIVKSLSVHKAVLRSIISDCLLSGLVPLGLTPSPITGSDGNTEYLIRVTAANTEYIPIDTDHIAEEALSRN